MYLISINTLQFYAANINIKNIVAIVPNTAIVEMKNLVKDAVFENLKTQIDWDLKYLESMEHESVCGLPLSFPETEMNILGLSECPYLLIPLFEIEDSRKQPISLSFFLSLDRFNEITRFLNTQTHRYFYSFYDLNGGLDNKINYIKFKTQTLNLTQSLFPDTFNYLIFRNHLSESAMLYVGMFFDKSNLNVMEALGSFYFKCLNDNITELDLLDCFFDISLNIGTLINGLDLYTQGLFNIQRHKFKLFPNKRIDTQDHTMQIKLKARKNTLGVFFQIEKYSIEDSIDIKVRLRCENEQSEIFLRNYQLTS
ncbi:hypothetical protein CDIK_2780 [Cucumispora dikerogammari]|nr:hypothetical protein CDIK_2780 [Cucumispora dikerogammari]